MSLIGKLSNLSSKNKIIDNFYYKLYSFAYSLENTYNPMLYLRRMKEHGVLLRNFRINIKTLPAKWQDSDGQILHVNFHILNQFVEEECSHMAEVVGIVEGEQTKLSKREKAFIHMDAYITAEEDSNCPGNSEAWAKAYTEIKDLYVWWNDVRPARHTIEDTLTDAYTNALSIMSMNQEERKIHFKESPEAKKVYDKWSKEAKNHWKLEGKYDVEDTKNLIRLMKVRQYMWT